nr:helix-turn-helix domain-containing protein [Curtobacterium sp. WW7]
MKVITWVLYEAPVTTQSHLLVLLALADRAHDDGSAAYPAREWIADRARCSVRSVASHLRALEDAGLIRKGDQDLVSHFRADRRPVVYDVVMTAGKSCTPPVHDVQSDAPRGARSRTHDVQPVAHKPSLFSFGEEPVQNPSIAREDDWFELVWTVWPKHDKKKPAREKFVRLVRSKVIGLEVLVAAIRDHGQAYTAGGWDEQFVPGLLPWLNQERWNDPLPRPRHGRMQERQDDTLALIARMAEEDARDEQAGDRRAVGMGAGHRQPSADRVLGAGVAPAGGPRAVR